MSGVRARKHSSDADDEVKGDDPSTISKFLMNLVMGEKLGFHRMLVCIFSCL